LQKPSLTAAGRATRAGAGAAGAGSAGTEASERQVSEQEDSERLEPADRANQWDRGNEFECGQRLCLRLGEPKADLDIVLNPSRPGYRRPEASQLVDSSGQM
jgi:hypothetical protein